MGLAFIITDYWVPRIKSISMSSAFLYNCVVLGEVGWFFLKGCWRVEEQILLLEVLSFLYMKLIGDMYGDGHRTGN